MSQSRNLGRLSASAWRHLQELADRFHEAWQRGEPPDPERFLPPLGDPLRGPVLDELIAIDLEMRWRRGQATQVEDYLAKYPELGPARSLSAALVFQEYHVRHQHGDRPALESYRQRFPDQFEELRRLVQGGASGRTRPDAAVPTPKAGNGAPDEYLLSVAGGYRLVRRIASATFGEVWRGEAPGGVPVAIKILFRPADAEEARRELAALELVRTLRHRCLIQLHGFWAAEGRLYIVMELADGSLRDRLNECRRAGLGGIPADELFRYFQDAAEGLDVLHAHHVQHRDVKPENILLVQGHAKVADFGIARPQGSRLLSTVSAAGTPLYMAPEVFRGKVSPHSDQYGLALAYAELRLGRRLLDGANLLDIMHAHLEQTPDLSPLPEAEQRVILRALSKNPDQRYPTCQAWVEALEEARAPAAADTPPDVPQAEPEDDTPTQRVGRPLARTGSKKKTLPPGDPFLRTQPVAPTPTRARPPRRRHRAWLVLVLLVVLGGIAANLLAFEWPRLFPAGEPTAPLAAAGGATAPEDPVVPGPATARETTTEKAPAPGPAKTDTAAAESPTTPKQTEPASLALDPVPAVVLGTGEEKRVPVRVRRRNLAEPVSLSVAGLPAGVTAADVPPLKPDADTAELHLTAGGQAATGVTSVKVRAEGGDLHEETSFLLTVVFLPPDYRPAGPEVETDLGGRGKPYYKRIRWQRPGGPPADFVLIPKARPEEPETFYMMVNKVTVGLFRQYVREPKARVREGWNEDAGDGFPVFNVGVEDAYQCAQWLHGDLPAPAQWDRAAGLQDQGGREGPFQGKWDPDAPLQIAVRRDAPLKAGEAQDDEGPFGCRDMAGNGWEWTRAVVPGGRRVPLARPTPDAAVRLRGHSFQAPGPLLYKEMEATGQPVFGKCPYELTLPDLSFRVVIEPN